ncbi:MAG: hypothetical protein DSY37_01715 [Hyperthermus sp.]|nr:MAG: hypothetical protein DSY37_01715 [Hyperthermus sp.]
MPLVAIGLDSFDTAFSGCTTHLASLITLNLISEDYELADNPWLVRLNPAVPWKTRGNGAVALIVIVDDYREASTVARLVKHAAKAYGYGGAGGRGTALVLYYDDAGSVTDYVAVRERCLESLYSHATTRLVAREHAEECLHLIAKRRPLLFYHHGGRGLIGALAALGADFREDYTYELLAYRSVDNWLKKRMIDEHSVIEYDLATRPLTFMNYDYEVGKPLIHPHTNDPVLYGVRGEEREVLIKALTMIDAGEAFTHWTLYRTNQATNAHLRLKTIEKIRPYDNVVVHGVVSSKPRSIPGGHTIATLRDHSGGEISIAAYRESGRIRKTLALIEAGAPITVAGQVKPHGQKLTLNIEQLTLYADHHFSYGIRSCSKNTIHPPLSSLHHLAMPPERCLYRGGKRWPEQKPREKLVAGVGQGVI